jgi:serine/threonine protein kinase
MKTKQHIIGQGTYGCIFKPGFTCKGKPTKNDKFITKIQKKESTSNNEVDISKKIKSIAHYKDFFAPILSTCAISLAEINSNEIQKCEFINDDNNTSPSQKYESNKIQYIGKYSLQESILNSFLKNSKTLPLILLRTHTHLLSALQKLANIHIIHFDLKENNIIMNHKTKIPIIIDFGLSLDTTNTQIFNEINYKTPFYFPWPLDVTFISMNNKNPSFIISDDFLKQTINDFLKESYTETILTNTEIDDFKLKQLAYYSTFIGKSIQTVSDECKKHAMTWDNYSLTWTYLDILKTLFFTENIEDEKLLKYRTLLIKIIISLPYERPNAETTKKEITELFDNYKISELQNIQKKLSTITPENIQKIKTKVSQHSLRQLIEEQQLVRKNTSH